jgi:MFS family permease
MTTDSNKFPKYRWLILIAAALTYANAQIINLSIAPVLPSIAQNLGIDLGVATNFMAAFLFSGCIIMFTIGGAIGDRFGILPTLLFGLLLAVIPAALMPLIGHSYSGVFAARLVQGLSPGFIFPVMGSIIAIWFPEKEKGLATGLMGAAVSAGSAAGTLGGPAIFGIVDAWQKMAAWVSVLGWFDVIFIIILLVLPKPEAPVKAATVTERIEKGYYLKSLIAPITLIAILVNFMASWNMHCLYSMTPTFLSADTPVGAGYGAMVSGQLMISVTLISGILGPLVCGFFVDRLFCGRTKEVFVIGFILSCLFMFAIKTPFFYGNKPLLSVALVLAGFGVQFIMPAVYIFSAKSYSHKIVAKMTGLIMGIGTLGGVFGLYISGITLNKTGNYSLAFSLISLAALAGLILTFILSSMKPLIEE